MLSLPPELYRSIVGNLHHDHDRKTLLSASLCDTNLRDESQRVLFRSTNVLMWWTDPLAPDENESIVLRHEMFLEAVVASPDRLALYVRDYTQIGIGTEPGYTTLLTQISIGIASRKQRDHVWELTMKALPTMINLKKLCFAPFCSNPSAHILRRCTFQLHVLDWRQLNCEDELMSSFIPGQKALRHIAGPWSSKENIPRDVLPQLVSVGGQLQTLISFSQSVDAGKILAFDDFPVVTPTPRELYETAAARTALSRIKYLRTWDCGLPYWLMKNYKFLHSVELLEVPEWHGIGPDICMFLPSTLIVLSLGYPTHLQKIAPLKNEKMRTTALTAFCRGTSLKYVEFRTFGSQSGFRIPRPATLDDIPDVNDVMFLDHEVDWWKREVVYCHN